MVYLDDLDNPRFAPDIEEIRGFMTVMAEPLRLESHAMHEQARAETGLSDFGPRDYEERLDVLLAALHEMGDMDGPGLLNVHSLLLQMLRNRLLMTDLLARHPEIHEIELVPPVVIAGLPRTGTTHLHNLLSAGPTFRSLPYWESMEPFPMAAEVGVEPDPRRARMDLSVDFMNSAMPYFPLMHEMTTDHVHEEIQLLANDFSSIFFETFAEVPAWRDYYLDHDQTPHYRHLRTQLQALQHLRGGRRWVLKSPQHLEQLPALEAVFPGLTVVVTHRDPVPVTLSMCTMVAYTARMHRNPVPAAEIGRYWCDRLDVLLTALMKDRDVIPAERSIDVRFDEFMADDLATAERIYEIAGEPLTDEASAAMAEYLAGHQRGRHGTVEYRAEDVGLDLDEVRERFAPYVARFLS